MALELKDFGDKNFLSPDNNYSCAMYSSRVKPEDAIWRFRIHDCDKGICLHGKLEKEEDFNFAKQRLINLVLGIEKLIDHLSDEKDRIFYTCKNIDLTEELLKLDYDKHLIIFDGTNTNNRIQCVVYADSKTYPDNTKINYLDKKFTIQINNKLVNSHSKNIHETIYTVKKFFNNLKVGFKMKTDYKLLNDLL